MRRIISGVLLAVFLAQSAGASALAADPSRGSLFAAVGSGFAAILAPLQDAWLNSATHAMLSGQMSRYEAMHAPAPRFPRVIRILRAPDASRSRDARMVRRYGYVVQVPGRHGPEAIDPHKAPRDPMAMRRGTAPPATTSTRTLQLHFAPRFGLRGRFAAATLAAPTATSTPVVPVNCPMRDMRGQLVCCNPPCPTFSPPPTATPSPTPSPTASPTPSPSPTPVPTPTASPTATPSPTSSPTSTPTPNGLAPSTTGINHYWTYEEEPLPGMGRAMVNVGDGNLLMQVDDLDVPGRGIDLAFRRTYNSQSQHDASGTDGSTPSVFGNGWTNTFDAHLAYNTTYNVISVYDIDGARYDFCANGGGGWQSCTSAGANSYTTLTSDGSCGYYWTKKNGTAYYFEAPNSPPGCAIPAGLAGRLLAIQGRNINNSLTFTYSWVNGDATNPQNLTQIVVAHSDGQSLTLTFALLNGTGPDELQSISRPDGSLISYQYDSSGNLTEVDRPGNATTSTPNCVPNPNWNPLCIPETYTYAAEYLIASANSPRYTVSQRNNGGIAQEGDTVNFGFDSSRRATSMTDYGVVNFTPQDGVSPGLGSQGLLQQGYPTGLQSWYTEDISGYDSGTTTVGDSDGHSRMWTFDSLWRVDETQEYTGSQWLVSYDSWDNNDNLITFTDERGNISTFAFDGSGNAIMEAQPQVATSMGTFQPTAWYQYDQYNNLLYYCDPNWAHSHGGDYPNGSDPCTGSPSGVVHYVWATGSSPEIYGELTDTYTPLGYHRRLSYDTNGMPLSVVGDTISQADNTQRTPTQSFTYDGYGNLQTYNTGVGTWHLTYDNLNRVLIREDPDNVYSYVCYYADGSVHYTETSYQRQLEQGPVGQSTCAATAPQFAVSRTYDADGDISAETLHHSGTYNATGPPTLPGTANVMQRFYDADDRLVEVEQPYDPTNDLYTNPWITRSLYDLSQDGSVGFNEDATYAAHGNLYKTQELLPSGTSSIVDFTNQQSNHSPPSTVANTTYQDLTGTSYDALDRPTTKYSLVYSYSSISGSPPTNTPVLNTESLSYDSGAPTLGLLAEDCNSVAQCKSFRYDARASVSAVTFSDSTPSRSWTYDANGRTVSVTSSVFGAQTNAYDADGRLTTSQEPSGGGVTSPALLTRHYYPDGERQGLDIASSALNQVGLFTSSYRTDGRLQTLAIDDASISGITNPGTTTVSYAYSSAGRLENRAESGVAANGTPTTITYDSNGMEIRNTTPGDVLSGFEYTAEAELLGFNSSQFNSSIGGGTYSYDLRGELVTWPAEYTSGSPNVHSNNRYANGVAVTINDAKTCQCQQWQFSTTTYTIDARMGVQAFDSSLGGGMTATWGYDTAGRLTVSGSGSTSWSRSFDAENHVVTTQGFWGDTNANGQLLYLTNAVSWGPNGHPILVGGAVSTTTHTTPSQSDTLHWDGDQLLFTTNSSGQLDDIKVGTQGDILPLDTGYNGITFYDRLPNGNVMGCHNTTGATYAGVADSYLRTLEISGNPATETLSPCSTSSPNITTGSPRMPSSIVWWSSASFTPGKSGAPEPVGEGGVLGMPRTDGITDYTDAIQGARAYDSNAGTWTAPDAYAGDVGDPASQKAYMWNDNNPVMYGDPSGYDTIDMVARLVYVAGQPIPDVHLFIVVYGDAKPGEKAPIKATYGFGPEHGNPIPSGYGKLVQQPYPEDSPTNSSVVGSSQIGSCVGVCTPSNGGINEPGLAATAGEITNLGLNYKPLGPNSNSAAYTECENNGGKNCANTNTGGFSAPGDGQNLLPPGDSPRGPQPPCDGRDAQC